MANKKILIVEDNEFNLELISDILKIRGYEIISTDTIQGPYSKVQIAPIISTFFKNYRR